MKPGARQISRSWMIWGAVVLMGFSGYAAVARAAAPAATPRAVINQYAAIVHASYEDAYASALALRAALDALVQAPSPETLQAAKAAWKRARIPYGQTEAYRFYAGPIDGDNGPEGMLNAWPLDESYIDYVEGAPTAGIINHPEIVISDEKLRSLNEEGGEANVSTGFHAIEFLLWGQDQSDDGPGARPHTDYETAQNAVRRGQYLLTVAEMLTRDLQGVAAAWAPDNPHNYRAAFLSANPMESLRKMLSGIGVLSQGELAGERMAVALSTRDQEDEHSCFSDNTHVDIMQNAQGIRNVYEGRYARADGAVIDGPGIGALLSPELNASMMRQLEATTKAVNAIEPPFDREIVTEAGRKRVSDAIEALRAQAALIVSIAKSLGIANLQVEIPE